MSSRIMTLTAQEGCSVDLHPQFQHKKPGGPSFTSEKQRLHFKRTHTFFTNMSLPTTVHSARLSIRVAYRRDSRVRGEGVMKSMIATKVNYDEGRGGRKRKGRCKLQTE
jgi:hypothetical protein